MTARLPRVAGLVLLLLALDYAVLVGIGLLLTKVFEKSALLQQEADLERALEDGRTPGLNDVTYVLSGLGNTGAIIGALLVVAIGLYVATRRWGLSIYLVLAVSAQAIVFLLVTLTISRQRPDVKRLDASPPTSSFPSGHTGAATALFVASALLVIWLVRRQWVRTLAATVLLAVPLLVAFGRLSRGMHHPTDILGAFLNASVCIAVAAGAVLARGPLARLFGGPDAPDPQRAPDRTGAHAR